MPDGVRKSSGGSGALHHLEVVAVHVDGVAAVVVVVDDYFDDVEVGEDEGVGVLAVDEGVCGGGGGGEGGVEGGDEGFDEGVVVDCETGWVWVLGLGGGDLGGDGGKGVFWGRGGVYRFWLK